MSIGQAKRLQETRQHREHQEHLVAAARTTRHLLDRLSRQFPELPASELLAHIEGRYEADDRGVHAQAG